MVHGTAVVIARQGDSLCITFKLGIQEDPFLRFFKKQLCLAFVFAVDTVSYCVILVGLELTL